jgi:ribose transport system substrate-binding protein
VDKTLRAFAALLVLAAMALTVVACGDDDDDSSSGSDSGSDTSGSSGGGSDLVAESKAIVEKAKSPSGTGEFPFPDEAFDAGKGTAMVISTGDTGCPTCQLNADRAVEAVKAAGWEVGPHRDGKFQPAVVGGFLQEAAQKKLDAVVVITHNMGQSVKDIKAALDAGVSIACVNCDIPPEVRELGIPDASVDFTAQGELAGRWVVADSNGKANTVIIDEPSRDPVIHRVAGVTSVLDKCEECETKKETISVAEVAKPGPPAWRSLLQAEPDMGYAMAYFDGIAIAMAATAQSAGSDVKISGYDTDEAAVELMKKGAIAADIAIPYEYQDWSAVDLAMRMSKGLDPWEASDMPFRLIVPENVDSFDGNFAPEGDWKQKYLEQWGKG